MVWLILRNPSGQLSMSKLGRVSWCRLEGGSDLSRAMRSRGYMRLLHKTANKVLGQKLDRALKVEVWKWKEVWTSERWELQQSKEDIVLTVSAAAKQCHPGLDCLWMTLGWEAGIRSEAQVWGKEHHQEQAVRRSGQGMSVTGPWAGYTKGHLQNTFSTIFKTKVTSPS